MRKFLQIILGVLAYTIVGVMIFNGNITEGAVLAFALPAGFEPLKWPCGSENMGGYKNRLLFIPACSVKTVPELPTEIVASEDLVTAAGAFVFNDTGDKPIFIYATPKTVKLNGENQGETDGQSFLQKLEFFHPGSKAETGAFARVINNTPGYFIVEDPAGVQYMVGSKGLPAHTKPGFSGGGERTDRKGVQFALEADSFAPYIILGTPIDMDELENPVIP